MIQNTYDAFNQFMKEKYSRDRELREFLYKQGDSFAMWIIGFAFAGLTLIASKADATTSSFKDIKNILILLLGGCILSGIACRYFSYVVIVAHKQLEDYFAGFFTDIEMQPIELDRDIDQWSFEQVVFNLESDFEEKIPYQYPVLDDIKELERTRLIRHYKLLCEHSKKMFDLALDHWAKAHAAAYKLKKEKLVTQVYNEIKNPKIGFKLNPWAKFVNALFLITLLLFIAAVIVVCYTMYG